MKNSYIRIITPNSERKISTLPYKKEDLLSILAAQKKVNPNHRFFLIEDNKTTELYPTRE